MVGNSFNLVGQQPTQYLASRGFSLAWLLAFTKSFAWLVRCIVGRVPTQRFWRETVSLLDVIWPQSNHWECEQLGRNFQLFNMTINNKEKMLQELIIWSPNRKSFDLLPILLINSYEKYMVISVEILHVHIGLRMVRDGMGEIQFSQIMYEANPIEPLTQNSILKIQITSQKYFKCLVLTWCMRYLLSLSNAFPLQSWRRHFMSVWLRTKCNR